MNKSLLILARNIREYRYIRDVLGLVPHRQVRYGSPKDWSSLVGINPKTYDVVATSSWCFESSSEIKFQLRSYGFEPCKEIR